MRNRRLSGRDWAIIGSIATATFLTGAAISPSSPHRSADTPGSVDGSSVPTMPVAAATIQPSAIESAAPTTTPAPQTGTLPTCPAEDERFPAGYGAFH